MRQPRFCHFQGISTAVDFGSPKKVIQSLLNSPMSHKINQKENYEYELCKYLFLFVSSPQYQEKGLLQMFFHASLQFLRQVIEACKRPPIYFYCIAKCCFKSFPSVKSRMRAGRKKGYKLLFTFLKLFQFRFSFNYGFLVVVVLYQWLDVCNKTRIYFSLKQFVSSHAYMNSSYYVTLIFSSFVACSFIFSNFMRDECLDSRFQYDRELPISRLVTATAESMDTQVVVS